jgi:hypothetical protein
LKAGGSFVFNVWDSLAENPVSAAVNDSMTELFPADPPRFLARTPHGYHDVATVRADLARAGFTDVSVETVRLPCRAASHRDPAIGFCQGSPLRSEIEARIPVAPRPATETAAAAVARRFGAGAPTPPCRRTSRRCSLGVALPRRPRRAALSPVRSIGKTRYASPAG